MVLLGVSEGSRAARFGSNKPSFRQAILSPSWNSRRCNHRGMRLSRASPPVGEVEASQSPVAAVGASQSLVAAVGALAWWDTRCGDAGNTTPSCPSPTMTVHRRRNWDPPAVRVGAGAAVLVPGAGAGAAEKALGVVE